MKHTILAVLLAFVLAEPAFSETSPWGSLEKGPYDPATDVDVDMFMNSWQNASPERSYGDLIERKIFTRNEGDPMQPPRKGAVLKYANRFSYAELPAAGTIPATTLRGEQVVFFCLSGTGTVSGAGEDFDIYPEVSFIIPEGLSFSMEADAENPLTFYLVSEPTHDGFVPRKTITWHDEATSEYDIAGAHWCNANKFLIDRDDGQAMFQYVLDVRQFSYTMAQPHSHNPGFEEIWCTIEGPGKTLLGKQLRDMPPGMAFKVPPDGKTPHAHINPTGETVRYFEFAIHGPDYNPRGENIPFSRLDGSFFNPDRDIDADMFMGSWRENYPTRTHGNLIEREILTKGTGNPSKPERAGAVLNRVKRFVYATLEPRDSTLPTTLKGEQEVFYILSGAGILRGGSDEYDLHGGVGFLVPEGLEFTITNIDRYEPLTCYLVSEPTYEGFTPNDRLVVYDLATYDYEITTGHWVNHNKSVIRDDDGTATLRNSLVVTLMPDTMAQPHSHSSNVEEVWCAISGDIHTLLGKHFRELPPGTAYMIPPDDKTWHANLNLSDKPVTIFYFTTRDGEHMKERPAVPRERVKPRRIAE